MENKSFNELFKSFDVKCLLNKQNISFFHIILLLISIVSNFILVWFGLKNKSPLQYEKIIVRAMAIFNLIGALIQLPFVTLLAFEFQ